MFWTASQPGSPFSSQHLLPVFAFNQRSGVSLANLDTSASIYDVIHASPGGFALVHGILAFGQLIPSRRSSNDLWVSRRSS